MNKIKLLNISLIFSLVLCMSISVYAAGLNNRIKDTTLRLHVVANSNSQEDQELKLRIRDVILEGVDGIFQAQSAKEAKETAREQTEKIRKIAREEIAKSGKTYNVEVLVSKEYFETKEYGDFVLPAGMYDAVKVIIGEGGGKNWWCVMFPPMCSGAVEDSEIVTYYEHEAGPGAALIIGGTKKKVELRFKSLDVIGAFIEKMK